MMIIIINISYHVVKVHDGIAVVPQSTKNWYLVAVKLGRRPEVGCLLWHGFGDIPRLTTGFSAVANHCGFVPCPVAVPIHIRTPYHTRVFAAIDLRLVGNDQPSKLVQITIH